MASNDNRSPNGPRGVLRELDVAFFGTGPEEAWRKYLDELDFHQDEAERGLAAHFMAFPAEIIEGAPYLVGGFHPTSEPGKSVHWHISIGRCSKQPPPEKARRQTAKMGGFDGALAAIARYWPGNRSVLVTVTASIDAAGAPDLLPKALVPAAPAEVAISTDGGIVQVRRDMVAMGWNLSPPSHGMTHILAVSREDTLDRAVVSGEVEAELSADFMQQLEAKVWASLARITNT